MTIAPYGPMADCDVLLAQETAKDSQEKGERKELPRRPDARNKFVLGQCHSTQP